MKRKLMFDVENLDIISESDSSQFATAKIQAFATGRSLHDTTCDIDTLKRMAPSIYEKPIVFELDNRIRDFGSHSNNPIISGFIVPNSAEFTQLNDGRIGLNVFAKIWKKYAPQFIRTFQNTGTDKKSVSVEMSINDAEEDSNGLLKLLDFVFESVCVLGDFVTPASPGANIEMLTFAEDENREYKKVYQEEFAKRYDQLDFKIPDEVKNNCQKGLDMYKETSSGATSVSLAYARYAVKNTHSSPDRIRQSKKYFSTPKDNETELSYNLWGGSHGKDWSVYMSGEMEKIDSKTVSYFDLQDKYNIEEEFSKEDWGNGDSLKVDKSKEAMSEKSWGEVDKTTLRNKILEASNYKSLVKDVYALVEDGWEDSPTEHLKYPIMELKGDTLVYNRYGLSAALQRAEGQNETSVVSKVKSIYTKMGLDKPDNNKETEEKKNMAKIDEEDKAEGKEEEMAADKKAVEGSPEEEKKETPEEEKKESPAKEKEEKAKGEDNSAKMSLSENLDVAALLEFLKAETQSYREVAGSANEEIQYATNAALAEISKGPLAQVKSVTDAMISYMKYSSKQLSEFSKANAMYSEENKILKEFKTKIDGEKKDFEVNSVLKEAEEAGMPDDELNACKMEAVNYSLDEIDAYKNMIKAKAFKYFGKKQNVNSNVTRIGLPFQANDYKKPSLWEKTQ